QFRAALSLPIAEDRHVAWLIAEHLTVDLSLPALARQAAMIEHGFSRQLRGRDGSVTGAGRRAPPGGSGAASAFRLAIARQTDCAAVRLRIGGDDAAPLLRVLLAAPQDYRARFGSKRANGE